MKKVLGWAVVAMLVGMVAYFGLLRLDVRPFFAAFTAASIVTALTVVVFNALYAVAAVHLTLTIFLIGSTFGTFGAVAATLVVAIGALSVARKLKVEFQWVFIAYLIEGAGIYGSLKTGFWQPAAVVAFILGIWWLAVWLAEKKKLRLASV